MKAICLLAIGCVLLGCAAQQSGTPATDRYMVTAERTPFYRYGPAQGTGPDFVLMKNDRVTMLRRSFGFCQVSTERGQTGYVPTEDIAPAPPPAPPPPPKPARKKQRSLDFFRTPPPPPQGLPDPNLPMPSFRY